jgi:AcrR family transcriptional regulator
MSMMIEVTRRTVGARVRGRSARVVEAVLNAAANEFARSGYEGFRVDAVAHAAGVNKTSVYRRWPTKLALIATTLRHTGALRQELPDTGSLRGDLRKLLNGLVNHYGSAHYREVLAMVATAQNDPAVREMCAGLREEVYTRYDTIIDRAIARGEVPRNSNRRLIMETVLAPVAQRFSKLQLNVTAEFIDSVVELVVRGAEAGGAESR